MATWCAIGAIINYWDKNGLIAPPIDLANGVSLVAMPNWARSDAALDVLSWNKKTRVQENCRFALYVEYEATALGTPDPDWRGPEPRPIQDHAGELLTLANLALWLARPARIPVEVVLHFDRPGDGTSIRESSAFDGLLPHVRDLEAQFTSDDLSLAMKLNESLVALTRGATTWTATRLLWKALQERMWEARFLLEWIALEALFGSSNPQETTFRLSQRVAFFLADSRERARELFNIAKTGYGWRSKTVHGLRLSKLSQDDSAEISHQAECLLRETFCRVLTDPELVAQFDGNSREDFLDSLIFS
mgnify:CR=1 FL=1